MRSHDRAGCERNPCDFLCLVFSEISHSCLFVRCSWQLLSNSFQQRLNKKKKKFSKAQLVWFQFSFTKIMIEKIWNGCIRPCPDSLRESRSTRFIIVKHIVLLRRQNHVVNQREIGICILLRQLVLL